MVVSEIRQKDIFLESEADAWFERNREACASQDFANDPVSKAVLEVIRNRTLTTRRPRILEIGCGEGRRLAWLATHFAVDVFGIEPSAKAVAEASKRGLRVLQGTADVLPYDDENFDIVIFGFCLYLCDIGDLFRIAQEADRVLKSDAWVVIQDFFSATPLRRNYHHKPGLYSHKMDFRKLFDWHPAYSCYSHRVVHHVDGEYCDDPQEWVATSTLRKRSSTND